MKSKRFVVSLIILITLLVGLFAKTPLKGLGSANAQSPIGTPVGQSGTNWSLTFNDEFDGTFLNRTTWRSDYFPNGGNGEMQQYVSDNSHNNYAVQNGMLQIIARQDPLNGQPYTSGIVHTKGRFLQKYGFFEMRAKVPYGKGYWPAFWLLPDQDNWVPEIDVTEILGNQPSTTYMTLHYYNSTGAYVDTQSQYTGSDLSAGWHTFAVDWEPTALVWYVDGIERKRVTDTAAIPNMPLYVIANLAVGGNWPGAPDSTTVFPGYLNIDYIRVWQKGTAATAAPTLASTQVSTSSGNMIANSSFEDTAASPWNSPWTYRNDLSAAFTQDTTTSANNTKDSLKASLTSSNNLQPWVVSVNQTNKNLNGGQSYTLSFWAKASATRPIRAVVQEQNSPYTEITNQTANLTGTWARYTYTFTAPSATTSAMLNFNLADAAGSVWLDEVTLCPAGTTCTTVPVSTPLPSATPTKLASPTALPSATPTKLSLPTATLPSPISGQTATPVLQGVPTATATFQVLSDTTAPSIAITNPLNNAQVKRKSIISLSANAADNIKVAKVDFLVNGSLLCTAATAPYSCNWSVPNSWGVTYTIVAKAYDTAQNNASSTVTVTSAR